jgi:protein TonB
MDLQRELLESSRSKSDKRSLRASAASLVLHGLLVGGIVYAGTQNVTHKVDNGKKIDAFITQGAAPPPPPPPPPAKSSGLPKPSTQKPVEIPKPMTSSVFTAPVEIPTEVPDVDVSSPEVGTLEISSSDALAGVAGGVTGGVEGGVVGGQIGGVVGGIVGGEVGGTGTGTAGFGTGGTEAPVVPESPPPPPPPAPPPPPPPDTPLRVGGDVKAPVAIDRAEPNYTDTARKARVAGVVVVEAIIDTHGSVDNVKVVKGLPGGLSEEAVKAVRRWKFRPGTLNGKAVATIFNLTVTFQLN